MSRETLLKDKSRYMSLLLRHQPEKEKLVLDKEGWCDVHDLLVAVKIESMGDLIEIVETNDKKRFAFNADKSKIRASQGHSVKVDLKMKSIRPPQFLYHGTISEYIPSIIKKGLDKGNRTYVHMSVDRETAQKVGDRRRSTTKILMIDAEDMYEDGYQFFKSENGVWLTDNVPTKFIKF